jgi:hypothetical protein
VAQREQAHVIEMERKATIRKRWEKPLKQETKAKLNVQRLFQQVVLKLRLDKDGRQSDSQKTVNQVPLAFSRVLPDNCGCRCPN